MTNDTSCPSKTSTKHPIASRLAQHSSSKDTINNLIGHIIFDLPIKSLQAHICIATGYQKTYTMTSENTDQEPSQTAIGYARAWGGEILKVPNLPYRIASRHLCHLVNRIRIAFHRNSNTYHSPSAPTASTFAAAISTCLSFQLIPKCV